MIMRETKRSGGFLNVDRDAGIRKATQARKRDGGVESKISMAPLQQIVVACSIFVAASTYLFDFGSNLVVLVQYSKRYIPLSRLAAKGLSACDADCRHQTSELAGYFYALLGILVCSHTLNAILFKLKFTHREAPLFAAYFLPLIHLYRLLDLVWRSFSCKGVQDLRSSEMNGLYCILGSALEGVPMLILQFCAYIALTRERIFVHSMSTTFKVSLAASLISAAYNGGTSVQSVAKNAITLKQKVSIGVVAGGFTSSAVLVRCLTFANLIVHIREYFSRNRSVREQAKFHLSDSIPPLFMAGTVTAYWLHYWLLHSPKNFKRSLQDAHRLLTSLTFSYMSMMLGPLYPMESEANDSNQVGYCRFRLKLCMISFLHVLLDLVVLFATFLLGTLPRPYLLVSVLGVGGYLVSLFVYMRLDASFGPKRNSSCMSSPYEDEGHATLQDEPASNMDAQLHDEPASNMDAPLHGEPAGNRDAPLYDEPASNRDAPLHDEPESNMDAPLHDEPESNVDARGALLAAPSKNMNLP